MTDDALVLRARAGDEGAMRTLLDRHRELIWFQVKPYFLRGGDRDDLIAEANLGFFKAIRDYREDRDSGFRNFAGVCVRRQVITALKTANRNKHQALTNAVALDAPVRGGGDGEDSTLGDLVADPGALNPADVIVQREELGQLVAAVGSLTGIERGAVIGIVDGESYEDIAASTRTNVKTIDNAAQRGRRKLTQLVGVGAEGLTEPEVKQARTLPPRRPQRRPGPAEVPSPTGRRHRTNPGGTRMSITDAIDAEKESVKEEIDALEAQLNRKRTYLEGLGGLADQAHALRSENGEGGGLPAEANAKPPEKPAPPKERTSHSTGTVAQRVEAIVKLVADHPDGIAAREIRRRLHLSAAQFADLRPELLKVVGRMGTGRSTLYCPKGASRPNPAPPRQGRAAAAPAKKPESRPEPAQRPADPPVAPAPPDPRGGAKPSSAKAEAKMQLNLRLYQAVVELVADSEPITGSEIDTMILEQIPEAERIDVVSARGRLSEQKRIEKIGEGYRIPATGSSPVPITTAEKEAVACLDSGKTAREVALNCETIGDGTTAATILEGLVRRGVINRRPGNALPRVYEARR